MLHSPRLSTQQIDTRGLILTLLIIIGIWLLTETGLNYSEAKPFTPDDLPWLAIMLRFSGILAFALLFLSWRQPQADQTILLTIAILCGISLMLMYRLPMPNGWNDELQVWTVATRDMGYVRRQAAFMLIGTILMLGLATTRWNYLQYLQQYRYLTLLFGTALLLITAFFGISSAGVGSPRVSLNIMGWFQLQPSELIKPIFVVFLASYLSEANSALRQFTYRYFGYPIPKALQHVWPMIFMLGAILVALVLMSDLGVALILIIIFPTMVYIALRPGVRRSLIAIFLSLLIISYLLLGAVHKIVPAHLTTILTTEQADDPTLSAKLSSRIVSSIDRVTHRFEIQRQAFVLCAEGTRCESYQILQGLFAIANGGLLGSGPGEGSLTYIPFVHTDMIFAAFAEEWGVLGAVGLLSLYLLIIQRGIHIAKKQSRPFYYLLAVGISTIMATQVIVIISGILGLLPLTGITTPFLSFGGTSILVNFMMMGVLLRISAETSQLQAPRPIQANMQQVQKAITSVFTILFITLFVWGVYMPRKLFAFTSDSKYTQNIVAKQRQSLWLERISRGNIYTADGTMLAGPGYAERVYPSPVSAHVVGQVDNIGMGISGIEAAHNDSLLGINRYDWQTLVARYFDGTWHGNDVWLTLDPEWQTAAHTALGTYDGAVVVLDAETGAVLAMVSHPLYEPNATLDQAVEDGAASPFVNRAINGLYPPGSTFKTVIGALAIDAGMVTPDTEFNFLKDVWYQDDFGRFCHKQWVGEGVISSCNTDLQVMSFAEGFAWSDNILFAQLASDIGHQSVWDGATQFGFHTTIPFDLPVETSSLAADMTVLEAPAQLAMTGFGQAQTETTPLHMALIAASITNKGEMPTPYLTEKVTTPQGHTIYNHRATAWLHSLNPQDANLMKDVMIASVEEGWASTAGVEQLQVGGKTGTSEWFGTEQGLKPHAWFIGFAEMPSGQVVSIAVLAESAGEGSVEAAPIAKAIFQQLSE